MGKSLGKEVPEKDQRTCSKGWCSESFSVGKERLLTESDVINKYEGQPRVRR